MYINTKLTYKHTLEEYKMNKKVVLAYSGGLDTSVAITWLKEQGYDVSRSMS